MSILSDFLPVAKDPKDLSMQPVANPSDIAPTDPSINDLLQRGSGNYPPPAELMQSDVMPSAKEFFSNMKPSLATRMAPQTFDWQRSGADRYVNHKGYQTIGFDPFLPAATDPVTGKAYDANELKYAAVQDRWDVAANAIEGFGALTLASGVNNLKAWGNTLNALFNWGSDKSFKERFMGTDEELKKSNDEQQAIFNKYAIYHTPQGDNSFFNKEFVGDMVQQLGFTVGTAAEMLGEMWLTAGIAEAFAPMRAASAYVRAGKAIDAGVQEAELLRNGAAATITGEQRINQTRNLLNTPWNKTMTGTLWEGAKKFVPFAETVGDLSAASKAGASAAHLASIGVSGITRTLSSFNAAKAESMMEAANTYGTLYGDLMNKYQDTHDGQVADGEELSNIKKNAYGAATDNFIVNTGLLSVMNELEFGNFMNKFSSSRRLLRQAAESGERDIFTVTGELKGTGQRATRAYGKGRFGIFSDANQVRKDFGLGTALWDVAKKLPKTGAFKLEIGEGIQEVLQNTSDQTFRTYYSNLYNGGKKLDGNSIFSDMEAIGTKGWEEGLATQYNKEGFKTFLMGAVTGLFLSPLSASAMYGRQAVLSKTSENYQKSKADAAALRKENLNTLNAFYTDPSKYLKGSIEGVKIQGKVAENITDALANSDRYEFNNSKDDALAKVAAVAIKTGNYESFISNLKEAPGRYSDEEFEKAFGIPATGQNKVDVKSFTDNVVHQLEQYHDNWQRLKDKYADLVMPELYTKDPAKYVEALVAKRALDESIELLANPSHHITQTLNRAAGIEAALASIPSIGASATSAIRILGNESYMGNEIALLKEEIKSYEGLTMIPDAKKLKENAEQQLKHLETWHRNLMIHQALTEAPKELYEQKGFTGYFADNREQMLAAYKGYIEATNKKSGITTPVMLEDVEKAFKSTADHIALTRDNGHYVEALNILSDPKNFSKLFSRVSDALYGAKLDLYNEHLKEVNANIDAATGEKAPETKNEPSAPVQEEPTPAEPSITSFADRIVKGENLNSPEDIQFYENNRSAIEAELRKRKESENKPAEASDIEAKRADIERRRQEELDNLGQKRLTIGFQNLKEAKSPKEIAGVIASIEINAKQGAKLSEDQKEELENAKANLEKEGYEIVIPATLKQGDNAISKDVKAYEGEMLTQEQVKDIEGHINSREKRGREVDVEDLPSPVQRIIKPQLLKDGKMVQAAEFTTIIFQSVEQAKEAIKKSKEANYNKATSKDRVNAKYDAELAALDNTNKQDNERKWNYRDIRENLLQVLTGKGVEITEEGGEEAHYSQESEDYMTEHPAFRQQIENAQKLIPEPKALRNELSWIIDKELSNKEPMADHPNIKDHPHVVQLSDNQYKLSVASKELPGSFSTIEDANSALESYINDKYPAFTFGGKELRRGQLLYDNKGKGFTVYALPEDEHLRLQAPGDRRDVTEEEIADYHEAVPEKGTVEEPTVSYPKMQILHSQVRVGASGPLGEKATEVLSHIPPEALMDGMTISVSRNANSEGFTTSPIPDNPHIKQYKQTYAIELNRDGNTLGYLTNANNYAFFFNNRTLTALELTPEQFSQVFDTEGKDPAALLSEFQKDYRTAAGMQAAIEKLLGDKQTVTISDAQLQQFLTITPNTELNYIKREEQGPAFSELTSTGVDGKLIIVNNSTGKQLGITDRKDLRKVLQDNPLPTGALGMYSAAIKLPNGVIKWIQLTPARMSNEELSGTLEQVTDAVKNGDIKEANRLLGTIFITLPVHDTGAQKIQIRLGITGAKNNMSLTIKGADGKKKTLTLGTRGFQSPEVFINAINSELDKKGYGIELTGENFHKQLAIEPTREQILSMEASVHKNPIRRITLTYGTKESNLGINTEPSLPVQESVVAPIKGNGAVDIDEEIEMGDEIPVDAEFMDVLPGMPTVDELSSAIDDLTAQNESEGMDPIAARLAARKKAASPAQKVLTPTEGFSERSVVNIDEFKKWVADYLPGFVSVAEMETLTGNLLNNNVTVGQFLMSLNTVGKVAGGVIQITPGKPGAYHEAFHSVFRLLLPQQQIDKLYKEAEKLSPATEKKLQELRDLHPSYAAMSDKELRQRYYEEVLADKFDDWMTDRSTRVTTGIKGFFNRLADWIQRVWAKLSGSQAMGLFHEINRKGYKNANLQSNQFTDNTDFTISDPALKVIKIGEQVIESNGKRISVPKYLPQQVGNQVSSTIAALFYQETQNLPQFNKNQVLDKILDRYAELLFPEQDRYNEFARTIGDRARRNEWLDNLIDRYELFTNEDSRQSLKEAVDVHLQIMGYKQELDDDSNEQIVNEYGDRNTENFDKNAASIGGFGSLAKFLRSYIGGTTYQYTDEFGNTQFSDGTPLVQAVNANAVYNGLLKVLSNTSDSRKMNERLLSYMDRSGNPETTRFIQRLIEETGFDRNTGEVTKNPILWQQVMKGFNQYNFNYLFTQANVSGADKSYTVSYANTRDAARNQMEQWQVPYTQNYWEKLKSFTDKSSKKKAFIQKRIDIFDDFFSETSDARKGKKITDEQLSTMTQQMSTKLKAGLGINLHPLYLQYSILSAKEPSVLSDAQNRFLAAYSDTTPLKWSLLSANLINVLRENLRDSSKGNLFARRVDESVDSELAKSGDPYSFLTKIAKENAVFDETVNTMSFTNANGEIVYGYQLPNFNAIAIQELNDDEHYNNLVNDPEHQSFLTDSEDFKYLQENKMFSVLQPDGLKRVVTSQGVDDQGAPIEYIDNTLDVNRERGVTYGDMNKREYIAFLLGMYDISKQADVKIRRSTAADDYFVRIPTLMRVIEAKNSGAFVHLPVVKSVTSIGNSIVRPSAEAVNIMYSWVTKEAARIQKVNREIEDGTGTDRGYHTGAKDEEGNIIKDYRGLRFFSGTADMLGRMRDSIEKGVLDPEYQLDEKKIKEQIANYWSKQITDFVQDLHDLGLININKKGDKVVYENRLLPTFFWKGFDESANGKMNFNSNFLHNIGQVFMNDYLNTTGINQLILGNEARSLKDSIDQVKRAAGLFGTGPSMDFSITAPQWGIRHSLKSFHHVTFEDPTYDKMSGGEGQKADGQMYMSEKALRYMLFGFGKLNKVQVDVLDKLTEGEEVTEQEFFGAGGLKDMGAFNSYKLVFNDGAVYLKSSVIALFKTFTSVKDSNGNWVAHPERKELHTLREKMEAYEQGKETIVFAHPVSVSKGRKSNIAPSIDGIRDEHFNELESRWMRQQLENPSGKVVITDPTQAKQQILNEQDDSLEVSFMGTDKDSGGNKWTIGALKQLYMTDQAARTANNYTSAVNDIFSIGDAMVELNHSIQAGTITPKLGNFMKRATETLRATGADMQTLGFFETDDAGEPIYDLNFPSTLQKFTQVFLSYFSRGVLSEKVPGISAALVSDHGIRKMKRVTSIWKQGDKGYTEELEGQPRTWDIIPSAEVAKNYRRYQNPITYDADRKFSGLQVGDIILDDLRHNLAEFDSEGNITGRFSEFLLPAHYPQYMNGYGEGTDKAFGIRIPSDDKHSYISAKFVDVLPVQYGSSIVGPQELIEISGADFDIDKLYLSTADTYVTTDGNRVPYGTATTDEGKFLEFVNWQLENNKVISSYVKEALAEDEDVQEAKKKINKLKVDQQYLTDRILDVHESLPFAKDPIWLYKHRKDLLKEHGSNAKSYQELEDFLRAKKGGYILGALNDNGLPVSTAQFIEKGGPELNNGYLNNRVLAAKLALLNNEHISGGENAIINQPTSTDPLLNLVKELIAQFSIEESKGAREVLSILNEHIPDVNSMRGKISAYGANKEGARNIGAAVNAMLTYSLLNQFNIPLRDNVINFDGHSFNSFGETKAWNKESDSYDGQRIFASISAVVNAMTDNAKERLAAKLGLNITAVGYVSNMVATGIPIKSAVLYMLQPAVRDYFQEISQLDGNLKTQAEAQRSKMNVLPNMIEKLEKKIGENDKVPSLNEELLMQNIKDGGTNPLLQLAALQDLQKMEQQGTYLQKVAAVMKLSQGLPTDIEGFNKILQTIDELGYNMTDEEFEKSAIPFDIRRVLRTEHPVISNNIKIVQQVNKLMPSVFLEKTPLFQRMTYITLANMGSIRQNQKELFNRQLKFDLISYMSLRAYIKSLQDRSMYGTLSTLDNALIYDTARANKAPTYEGIVDIMKRLNSTLKGKNKNYLVSEFLLTIPSTNSSNKDGIDKIESNTWARLSEHQQQRLVDSFIDLYSNSYKGTNGRTIKTHDDAVALFNYLLVKDGGQFRSGTFLRYIPNFVFKDILDSTKAANLLLAKGTHVTDKEYNDIFGVDSPEQILNDFLQGYSTHIGNRFFIANRAASGTVPMDIKESDKGVDIDKVNSHLKEKGAQSPYSLTNNQLTIDLFAGIRKKVETLNTRGISITGYPAGKYNSTEKAMLAKNIQYIRSTQFQVEGVTDRATDKTVYKIQFPYSIQVAGQLYVLRSLDKSEGTATPTRFIEKGELMPQGTRAVYEKAQWAGSRGQFKGAGVFGPLAQPGIVAKEHTGTIENPPYAPTIPKGQPTILPDAPEQKPQQEQQAAPTNDKEALPVLNSKYDIGFKRAGNKNVYIDMNTGETLLQYAGIQPLELLSRLDSGTMNNEPSVVPSQDFSDIFSDQLNKLNDITDEDIENGLAGCGIPIE